ncbi:MAG: hypothetical protein ACPIA7_02640 [Akkermansiaceae bacterium]
MLIRFISFIQAKPACDGSHPRLAVMLIAAMIAASIVNTIQAASYIEPDHTTELFQLEKIPLPQHRAQQLGKSLAIIAQRKHDGSPANQLASARLLLLAMQLDPKNKRPYEISKALASGKAPAATPQHLITQCLDEAKRIQSLLSKPRAGAQANLLARLIKDACKMIQPNTHGDKDVADWKKTLPAIASYKADEKKITPKIPAPLATKPAAQQASKIKKPTPSSAQKPDPAKKGKSQFHITEQSLLLPVFVENDEEELEIAPDEKSFIDKEESTHLLARIILTLKPCDPKTSATQFIKILQSGNPTSDLDTTLKSLIETKHSNIPSIQGHVKFTNIGYGTMQQFSLTGPLALLLEASLANKPLRDDLCMLADVGPKGELSEPKNFWSLLTNLRNVSDGGRLVVSDQSLRLMEQLLVFKESDFFARWEVFSASNIDEAFIAAVKESNKELTHAGEIFGEIQKLSLDQEVVQLAADHDIRDQLEKIIALAPSHQSANILLLQGSGNRPTHLDKKTFRIELQPIIEDINDALPEKVDNIDIEKLTDQYDTLRQKLDRLEPVVDRSEKELLQETIDLTNDFKKLASLKKRSTRRGDDASTKRKVEECLEDMKSHGALLVERVMALDLIDSELETAPTKKEE